MQFLEVVSFEHECYVQNLLNFGVAWNQMALARNKHAGLGLRMSAKLYDRVQHTGVPRQSPSFDQRFFYWAITYGYNTYGFRDMPARILSDRYLRFGHAPEKEYLPVLAEQEDTGEVEGESPEQKRSQYLMMRGLRESQVAGRLRPLLSAAPGGDNHVYMAKDDRTTDFNGGIRMGNVLTVESLDLWVEDDLGVPLVDKDELLVHLLWRWTHLQ